MEHLRTKEGWKDEEVAHILCNKCDEIFHVNIKKYLKWEKDTIEMDHNYHEVINYSLYCTCPKCGFHKNIPYFK